MIKLSELLLEDKGGLRQTLQNASGRFNYTAPNEAYVSGKFGSEKDYGKVVSLNQLQAHKTSMLKGQGEGRGTKMLAEVLREAVRRGIKYYTFNAPSDAAQALHQRFERLGILEPFLTYKDVGGVSDNTAVYKITSSTPVEDVEAKFDLPDL